MFGKVPAKKTVNLDFCHRKVQTGSLEGQELRTEQPINLREGARRQGEMKIQE